MTYLIFDLIILAVLALFVLSGSKRGFVLTLCGFLAVFVAFIGASFLSDLLCAPVGRLIQPVLETSITQTLEKTVDETKWQLELPSTQEDGSQEEEEDSRPALPVDQALAALEGSKLYRAFGESLQAALRDGVLKATSSAAAAIAAYIAREVARLVLFLISFVVVLLSWVLLSHALDLAFKLPVLSSVNRGLGGVMGLVKGALIVFILCWLFKGSLIPQKAIEQTFLLKFFCENSPLSLLAMVS